MAVGGIRKTVLVVEDDAAIRFGVSRFLQTHGFSVVEADSCESARERFRACHVDAVLTDYRLPDGEALELISDFRREKPFLPIVVLTGHATIELAVQAVKNGAQNFFTKPVPMGKLLQELSDVVGRRAPSVPESSSESAHRQHRSAVMQAFTEEVHRLKEVDCSILIVGETGTGKTMLARWLHECGRRKGKPFVDLNCAGLARDLVEAELFGHERGAFTSAHAAKPGLFELAHGGTLFLDEIGDIDVAVQPKVLKAIEEKRFRRMGGVREQCVDVRVVAATHRDLREAARNNSFRADLYYRLSTVTIVMPSLRDRREDLPTVARELVESMSAKLGREPPELSYDAVEAMLAYDWPGNIRELKNVLERALHLSDGPTLTARDLRVEPPRSGSMPAAEVTTLRDLEREQIERALAQFGSVPEAARSLGISRSGLYAKAKALGLTAGRASQKIRLRPVGTS